MAQAPSGNAATLDADSLKSLLDMFTTGGGSKTTTSGGTKTSTSKLNLSDNTVLALVNKLLGQTNGLAALTQGQNASGMYNSTVNTQQANDLISRVTTDVAAQAAPKTETTTSTPTTTTQKNIGQVDPVQAALGAIGTSIGAKVLKRSGISDKIDGILNKGIDAIFGKSKDLEGFLGGDAVSALSSGVDFGSGVSSLVSGSGSALDSLSSIPAVSDLAGGSSAFMDGVGSLFGSSSFGNITGGVPVLGPLMSLADGDVGSAAGEVAGAVIGNALLPGVGGPIGSFVGSNLTDNPVASLGGAALDAINPSVICTELGRQGKLSSGLLALEHQAVAKLLSKDTYNGYRLWATSVAGAMKHSRLLSAIMAPIGRAYARELAHSVQPAFYSSTFLGRLLRKGEVICELLGKVTNHGYSTAS